MSAFHVDIIKPSGVRVLYGEYPTRKKALTQAATLCAFGIPAEVREKAAAEQLPVEERQ
jgi:hypothetical protein